MASRRPKKVFVCAVDFMATISSAGFSFALNSWMALIGLGRLKRTRQAPQRNDLKADVYTDQYIGNSKNPA